MASFSPPASRQSHYGGSGLGFVNTRPKSSGALSIGGLTSIPDDEQKTAVKVAIRLRPPLRPSDPNFELIPARFNKSSCHVSNPSTLSVDSPQGKKLFVFDRVFDDLEEQEGVWDYVSTSVDSFVQGYNVSILAYGQSGAGKSYTMGTTSPGEQANPTTLGIIPRAAAALFESLTPFQPPKSNEMVSRLPTRFSNSSSSPTGAKQDDRAWQLKASYVEIYNEQLRDLLIEESVPQNERTNVTIREDTKGRIILTGLKQLSINSIEDLMNALNFGSSIRQTDATSINSKSSRSHAIFSLNLIQKKTKPNGLPSSEKRTSAHHESNGDVNWITTDSKLHFVDLAGSERLKNSGLTGDRVKEGISINAGLASLGKVIAQLSSRAAGAHVSYRDSRLTRLLQDSLGGNAITYMIACINPIEFHLSETLNTVQYAQRARAIQSRPQIQQRSDEGDKQLIIDRLRAEIKFLREQIRSSQQSERRSTSSHDRVGRKHDRETELQEQLLDIQENYSALSQRHAKLVSELTKGNKGDEEQVPALQGALEASLRNRLDRSSNFAEAVEQVILEYEKTIQSLESSLSSSRSSLSTSESNLLEREAKIVYMEAVTQQLQARIQKAMDREQNNESYTRELESKLDGVSNGEEKQLVIIQDLRKELARIRESEASAEDYISTLEERLAESEQDTEVMHREISRLEQVIERQSRIGKLDNLLSELDQLRQDNVTATNGETKKPREVEQTDIFHDRLVATASGHNPNGELHPDTAEEEWKSFGPMDADDNSSNYASMSGDPPRDTSNEILKRSNTGDDERVHSPAQAKAIQDKLETMTMELFELRVDHESSVAELDDVSRKYQIALSTLAELQDTIDETHRPTSYSDRTIVSDGRKDGYPQRTSSRRILSANLPSRTDSPTLVEASETSTTFSETGDYRRKEETLAEAVRNLKRSNAEKDININELTENYSQLQDQHKDTLNYIDELKEEMQKLQTPTLSATAPANKRRSNLFNRDRETRIFAALQNLATEHFHEQPEAMKSFESNLSAVMTESQLRTERMQALDAEIAAAKKEINVKNTMISGLTRERSVLSVPSNMTLVATLRDHLVESQKHLTSLRENNTAGNNELNSSVIALKAAIVKQRGLNDPAIPVDSTKANDTIVDEVLENRSVSPIHDEDDAVVPTVPTQLDQINDLHTELENWESKHKSVFGTMESLEQQLLSTISGLETTINNAETLSSETEAAKALRSDIQGETGTDWEAEKARHLDQVAALQTEITGYKSTAERHAEKLQHLENSYAQIIKEVEEDSKKRKLTESELQTHRDLVMNLEDQIDQQKSLATFHQQGLKSLQDSHSKELDELKSTLAKQQAEADEKLDAQLAKHKDATSSLEAELSKAHSEISGIFQSLAIVLQEEPDSKTVHSRLESLAKEREALSLKHNAASENLASARAEMDSAKKISVELETKVRELTSLNEETLLQLERSVEKEQKSSRIVQELEEQLNTTYDQHKDTKNSLSSAQKERADVEKDLEEYRNKVANLEGQLLEMKRTTVSTNRDSSGDLERHPSNASALRKSNSQASLPSPPPAVPLPPLPLSNVVKNGSSPRPDTAGSPPPSRHTSKEVSASAAQVQQAQQQIDEQAARIKTVEKHLFAEKQLTQTLEEALLDLETQNNKTKGEMEVWRKRCRDVEEEASGLRRERGTIRNSIQAVEEERDRRIRAEQASRRLEEQMAQLNRKKKKQGGLNCF